MELYGTSRILENGELAIGEIPVSKLAKTYGTPLYVYDELFIREQMRAYQRPFQHAHLPYRIAYACKAFCTIGICQIAKSEGMWLDVVSEGELYTALQAGFNPNHICMNGNNKSERELRYAVHAGVGLIIVDNFYEIELLAAILREQRRSLDILLRVAPGVEAHTHEFISTGQQDSKFGFDLKSGQIEMAVRRVKEHEELHLVGLHSHIGSQIFDVEGFRLAAHRLAEQYAFLTSNYQLELSVLNLGGGLGVRYTEEDTPTPIERLTAELIHVTQDAFSSFGIPFPLLMLEPGRSIVAQAGTTLYEVGSRKEIPSVRTYVAVDGGMTDNPRLALYGAKYEAAIATRMHEKPTEKVSIAGKCCESGDMLVWDAQLPEAKAGDLLAISCTGAYNYSMASNYNRIPRPAAVLVKEGFARLLVARESVEDMCRLDCILDE
ncbi:diaminopimelate decarboxylase [Sulfoacidibacillus thermotolerans]|uniref:Diaminopimelate decarboxylase n=1 Tax=Sulfoacidibacillus thermotolerans TaxID=1765684 RepID=A0A2U3D7I5_SULT2|nr:diaminopimelate decarboxylase [Sulfoacidibacillus thermotolerans]PWI57213.1 diaminopimelate decarboxylase [Sulfoacidibacillus thermotolerans]